jgi:hypothetical protein
MLNKHFNSKIIKNKFLINKKIFNNLIIKNKQQNYCKIINRKFHFHSQDLLFNTIGFASAGGGGGNGGKNYIIMFAASIGLYLLLKK